MAGKKRPFSAKSLQLAIRQRCDRIAEERDALRELIADVEETCDSADEAIDALEKAVEELSRYV